MKVQKPALSKKGRIRSLTSRRSQWRREARRLVDEKPDGWTDRHTRCIDEITAIEVELAEIRSGAF